MPSSFTWFDYSEHERRKMLDAIRLFKDQGTVDELGIGTIREPTQLKALQKNRLKFISFTPGIALDPSGLGKDKERALLYWLLSKAWELPGKAPLNVLQGDSGSENFRRLVRSF